MATDSTDSTELYEEYADQWMKLAIVVALVVTVVNTVLVAVLGPIGGLLVFLLTLGAMYFLAHRLFESVDSLILHRIREFK